MLFRSPGEAFVCDNISGVLSSLGFIPETQEVAPGRTNVVCTISGSRGAPSLILNAHEIGRASCRERV